MPSSECKRQDNQTSSEPLLEKAETVTPAPALGKRHVSPALFAVVLIIVLLVFWALYGTTEYSSNDGVCRQLAIRREWRALSSLERLKYLRAVQCLSTIPSTVCNGTLHDEFAYIHSKIGSYSAPFLPWHRYFIYIYENTLRKRCQYEGTLPYWDWTQDWANLTEAPIWNTTEGFGGNGNMDMPATVGDGHCVQDGPFAGLQVQYYNEDWNPHCLSRGFLTGELQTHFGAQRLNSSAMAAVFNEPDYYGFLLMLEDGPHSAIPINVRGDFSRFTAPNDPIFFLHHAQVDRLWWKWQSKDLEMRELAYNGPSRHNSSIAAQLKDQIDMTGLAPNIPVSSVMTINKGLLCYKYLD